MKTTKDRVVTASIGLKLSTIEIIERRAAEKGMTFSSAGRQLIEQALSDEAELVEPPTDRTPTQPSPLAILEKTDAPI
jgi:hypothetical protein